MKPRDGGRRPPHDGATKTKDLPVLSFATVRAWSAWMAANHASSPGLWLKIAKHGSNAASITYADALDVALAWGWIDGQKGRLDDSWWLQRFTRRGPKSIWSKINRDKAMALIAAGEMKRAGLAEVERAKKDGRWEAAYESQSKAIVPPDLAVALKSDSRAARFFETLDAHNRYAVLFRIHTAKKPDTRAVRIEKLVAMLSRHEKLHK
jgi:uncharacterized protein YdeI (YjbR/CyaY-like superfamily)